MCLLTEPFSFMASFNMFRFVCVLIFLLTMLELYKEHSIALPYGGLITKILKAKLSNILANECVDIPEGPFGKGTMLKSNAQIQRFQAQGVHAPPIIPDP
jgi:hypothetical protein